MRWEAWEGGVEEEHHGGQGCRWGKLTQPAGEKRCHTWVLRGCPTHAPPAPRPHHALATHMHMEGV